MKAEVLRNPNLMTMTTTNHGLEGVGDDDERGRPDRLGVRE